MAVKITVAQLAQAIRVGTTDEETAQVTRLLAVATQLVTDFTDTAPDVLHDEAVVRIAGYLYDAPTTAYAYALQNSGAAALLIKYRTQRAGKVDGGNVTEAGVPIPEIDANRLIPAGGQPGNALVKRSTLDFDTQWGSATDDQVARRLASNAQETAQSALSAANIAITHADQLDVQALPTGGTTGQILAKESDDNYDADWVDAAAGSGVDQTARDAAAAADTRAGTAIDDAAAAKAAADAAETVAVQRGVDPGGTQGQVVAKKSGTDFDTEWVNPTATDATARSAAATAQTSANQAATRNPPAGGEKGQLLAKSSDSDYQYAWRNGVSQEIVGRVEALQHVTADLVATDLDKWVTAGDAASASVAVVDAQTLTSSIIGNAVYAGSLMQPNGGWEGNWILLRVNKSFPIADLRLRLLDTDNDHFYYYGSNDFLSQSAIRDEAGRAYYSVTLAPGEPSGPLGPALGSITLQKHLTRETEYTGTVTGNGSVPTGGAKDQVLAKKSATDYDAGWVTPAGGGGGLSIGEPTFEAMRNETTRTNAEITNSTKRAAAIAALRAGGFWQFKIDRNPVTEPSYATSPVIHLHSIAATENTTIYIPMMNINIWTDTPSGLRITVSGNTLALNWFRGSNGSFTVAQAFPTSGVALRAYKLG